AADEGRTDLLDHLGLRTLNDGNVREHVFALRDLALGRVTVNDPRTQVGAALLLDQARAELRRHIGDAVFLHLVENRGVNGFGLPGNRERRDRRGRIVRRLGVNRAEPFGERLRDFLRVTRRPDARTIDAAAAAVEVNAVRHQIEILLPLIHHVVAEQDFAEARAVNLHARIPVIALHGFGAAEDFDAMTTIDDLGAHLPAARINADGFARHAR